MRLSFHPEALVEYREATRYYGEQARGLGERFADTVEDAIKAVLASPRSKAASARGTRRYLLRRFPLAIHYVLERSAAEGQEEGVSIYAVRHVRREKGGWLHRLPATPEPR